MRLRRKAVKGGYLRGAGKKARALAGSAEQVGLEGGKEDFYFFYAEFFYNYY